MLSRLGTSPGYATIQRSYVCCLAAQGPFFNTALIRVHAHVHVAVCGSQTGELATQYFTLVLSIGMNAK